MGKANGRGSGFRENNWRSVRAERTKANIGEGKAKFIFAARDKSVWKANPCCFVRASVCVPYSEPFPIPSSFSSLSGIEKTSVPLPVYFRKCISVKTATKSNYTPQFVPCTTAFSRDPEYTRAACDPVNSSTIRMKTRFLPGVCLLEVDTCKTKLNLKQSNWTRYGNGNF